MTMDSLPVEGLKMQPGFERPGEAINKNQIRGKFTELRPDDRDYLCRAYHLSPDDLETAVRTGISLLTTDALSKEPFTSFSGDEVERPLPPMGGALKITMGEAPINKLGLYLHKAKVEELLGRSLRLYDEVVIQNDTGAVGATNVFAVDDEEKIIKLNTGLEYQPHTMPICSVALMKDNVVEVIIPIATEALDIEYEDGEDFSAIYVRGLDRPKGFSVDTMEMLINDASEAIEQARSGLALEEAWPKPRLILDASSDNRSGGRYMPPLGPQDGDGVLYIPANRLLRWSDNPTPLERQRIVRHEYMHAVDQWLGEGDETFSDSQQESFAILINEVLSGVRGLPEANQFDEQPLWFNKALVGRVFTESYVLGSLGGHANENIYELMASLLNNIVDPYYYDNAFEGGNWQQNPLTPMERAKYMACHAKLMEIVHQRISEKVR